MFVIFDEEHKKRLSILLVCWCHCVDNILVVTLARMFINQESAKLYTKCFELLYHHIEKVTAKEVKWKHIHGTGFIGITADMDSKQMSGRYIYCFRNKLLTCSQRLRHLSPSTWPWSSRLEVAPTKDYCFLSGSLSEEYSSYYASFWSEISPFNLDS